MRGAIPFPGGLGTRRVLTQETRNVIPAGAQLDSGRCWAAGGIWVTLKGPAFLGPLTAAPAPQEGLSPLCSEPPRNGSPAPEGPEPSCQNHPAPDSPARAIVSGSSVGTAFSREHSLPTASRPEGHLEPGLVLSKLVTLKGLNTPSPCGPSGQGSHVFSNQQEGGLHFCFRRGQPGPPVNSRDRSLQHAGGLPPRPRPPPWPPTHGHPATPTRLPPPSSTPLFPRSPGAPPGPRPACGIRRASHPSGEPGTRTYKPAPQAAQTPELSSHRQDPPRLGECG